MDLLIYRPLGVAALAISLATATPALAQLEADLLEAEIRAPRGTTQIVSATLQNATDETLYFTGIAASLPAEYAADDVYDDFVALGPETLAPREGWEGPILKLTVAPDAPLQVERFVVTLTGGFHEYDDLDLATLVFAVNDSAEATGVPASVSPDRVFTLRASNNPTVGGTTTLLLGLSDPRPVEVRVFDATGRLVRNLFEGPLQAGEHRLAWDGVSDSGQSSASGVYFIRAYSGAHTIKTKVVRIE